MGLLDFLLGGDDSSSNGSRDWDRSVFDSDRFRNNGILRVLQLRLWLINKLKPSFLYVCIGLHLNGSHGDHTPRRCP